MALEEVVGIQTAEIYGSVGLGYAESDKSRTGWPVEPKYLLENKDLSQIMEGLQNLYAPVRSRPAPPKFSPKWNVRPFLNQ